MTSYVLEKKESGGASWEALTTLPASVTDCELENMTPDKDYYMRVRAESALGVSDAAELSEPIRVRGCKKGQSERQRIM